MYTPACESGFPDCGQDQAVLDALCFLSRCMLAQRHPQIRWELTHPRLRGNADCKSSTLCIVAVWRNASHNASIRLAAKQSSCRWCRWIQPSVFSRTGLPDVPQSDPMYRLQIPSIMSNRVSPSKGKTLWDKLPSDVYTYIRNPAALQNASIGRARLRWALLPYSAVASTLPNVYMQDFRGVNPAGHTNAKSGALPRPRGFQ